MFVRPGWIVWAQAEGRLRTVEAVLIATLASDDAGPFATGSLFPHRRAPALRSLWREVARAVHDGIVSTTAADPGAGSAPSRRVALSAARLEARLPRRVAPQSVKMFPIVEQPARSRAGPAAHIVAPHDHRHLLGTFHHRRTTEVEQAIAAAGGARGIGRPWRGRSAPRSS